MKKVIIFSLIFVVLALVSWRIYEAFSEERRFGGGRGDLVVPVEINKVERKNVRDIGEFSGTLLPQSRFEVAPKVSGRLEQLMVNIGDTVNNNDLVAVLDNAEYTQQVIQAKAELDVSLANLADSKSALEMARRDYERTQELLDKQIASATELDSARTKHIAAQSKYDVAEAQIKQREAALKAAEVRLSYTEIRAVWQDDNGGPRTVAERFVDEGAMLRANDPIVSIVDLSSVRAIINVIEEDFPEIRIGQPTSITTDAYGENIFQGKVVRRAPVLQEESRQARVEIEIPNPEGLLAPGMFVRASIKFAEHEDVTVVPQTALVRRNGDQGVFRADLENMKAVFVPVQTGIRDGDWVEILHPDLEGMVVTLGQHLLEDGASISTGQPSPGQNQQSPDSNRAASPRQESTGERQ